MAYPIPGSNLPKSSPGTRYVTPIEHHHPTADQTAGGSAHFTVRAPAVSPNRDTRSERWPSELDMGEAQSQAASQRERIPIRKATLVPNAVETQAAVVTSAQQSPHPGTGPTRHGTKNRWQDADQTNHQSPSRREPTRLETAEGCETTEALGTAICVRQRTRRTEASA